MFFLLKGYNNNNSNGDSKWNNWFNNSFSNFSRLQRGGYARGCRKRYFDLEGKGFDKKFDSDRGNNRYSCNNFGVVFISKKSEASPVVRGSEKTRKIWCGNTRFIKKFGVP